jgi:hypothetical protein
MRNYHQGIQRVSLIIKLFIFGVMMGKLLQVCLYGSLANRTKFKKINQENKKLLAGPGLSKG